MDTTIPKSSVVIDPVAMNITNKIAFGTSFNGDLTCKSGVLIEGNFSGNLTIEEGPLVLMDGAHLNGKIDVAGDAYIFGTIGEFSNDSTQVVVRGELHLTSGCQVFGRIIYSKIAMYEGAQVHGTVQTLKAARIK